ncbi:uncharacterized protein LOC124164527 isoform X2 [Ischnura elegans]|uniref:uncharacterized protein LOC124164527 isoform X2 n=1 Tax=Ischnura elegans TaxID=197161 RepID=UPI001ED86FE4|nr:uncharacterized protein LOC124164527 isoform X2 [Ischnura elegans]
MEKTKYFTTVSRGGPRARPEPQSPSPDFGLRMDRAPTYPPTPSPIADSHAHCGNGGAPGPPGHGWHKGRGGGGPGTRVAADEEEEVEDTGGGGKAKRKKKKRKKEAKDGTTGTGGGKWTFGALFRRKNKKKEEEEEERCKESTEDEYGVVAGGHPPHARAPAPQSPPKRTKEEEEYLERLGGARPCAVHNGCSGCVGYPSRGRYRPSAFGSGSDCGRDPYSGGGTGLVRRDSSTSSHKERRELIKARVEAMRDRLPRDSSSEDEVTHGGSEGSWDTHRSRRGGHPIQSGALTGHPPLPAGSVGSAGSSPYMGRRSKFMGRTERFHQRRHSRDYREDMDDDDVWKRRQNGLPPQCVPWRVSQSDAEAPYIGSYSGPMDFGGIGSGSTLSHSPGPSPMNSPLMGGRRSVSSAAPACGYMVDGMGYPGGTRGKPRRFPSTPISPPPHADNHSENRVIGPPHHGIQGFPTRSRSTDLLLCWRPEEGTTYRVSEPNPFHFPSPSAQRKANPPPRVQQDANHHIQQLNARWPSMAPCRSPPPPPPPRDPQRKIAPPPQCFPKQFPMQQTHHDPGGYVTRRNFYPTQSQPSPQVPPPQQPQESPYVNVMVHNGRSTIAQGVPQGVQVCLADSQPRSRRPLRVTPGSGGYYGVRPAEVSYMSDSQVGSPGRRQAQPVMMQQHPPLESHHAVPFLAESPPPRCVYNRVPPKDPPQVAEGVVHPSRPLMRQQRLPVLNRSRSSSPAPSPAVHRPPLLHIRPMESDSHPFAQRGHSSAPQTPIDGPINRPLSIVSEEKGDVSPRIPPVPPARSSSRRSSISSLEALEYGVWGVDRPPKVVNKGPSGLEDALTELENIYKSLKFEDERDGDTDSNAMGSSEMGLTYDDQDRPLTDDMAYRRLHSKEKASPPSQQGVGGVVAQAGSFLLVSPTLGPAEPWTEPPPNSINPGEPDITLDDVVYRSVRQANAHISQDPQPPFGIPIGPVTRAPESDYLHVKPPSPSPTSRAKKTPDVVKDDLAFRSLRKDRPAHAQPIRPVPLRGITSPPPRSSSSLSSVSSPPPLPPPTMDFQAIRKKRAVRSLSANLLGILQSASNASARSMSPPVTLISGLPPQSPPSPRGEQREISFPTASPTQKPVPIPRSPSRTMQEPPSSVQSEDSEPCNIVAGRQFPDATSSDTLTEGQTDEPKSKSAHSEKENRPSPEPQAVKDSPGEVYEALGRVLSRVGKEPVTGLKETKAKGDQEDDLETLLVALAKEARATSENLGRELDQLRTTTAKMAEDVEMTRRKAELAFEKEFNKAIKGINKDNANQKPRPIDTIPGEHIERTKEYLISRSSSPGKVGAIASLALRELEKPRTVSSSSSPDSTKMDGMSVVVGKCTVGTDSNHPGSIISFTSSVGPIKSDAKRPSGKIDDSPALEKISAASEEIPMKSTGDISIAKEEFDRKASEVSASSASVPIKSGRPSSEVVKEMPEGREEVKQAIKLENEESNVKHWPDIKPPKVGQKPVNPVESCETYPSTLRIISQPVDDVCIGNKTSDNPVRSKLVAEDVSASSQSDQYKEQSPTIADTTPVTGSMRLIVRRDPDNSIAADSQNCVQQCSWVVRSEPDQSTKPQLISSPDSLEPKSISIPASVISNEQVEKKGSEIKAADHVGYTFVASEKSTKDQPHAEVNQPTAVVEEIQKEFDQLLCSIPAKKARKSDEAELLSTVRPRLTESKSLEHPKRTGRDNRVAHENLRRTFPKNLSNSFAKSSSALRTSNPADSAKVEEVSCAFEREFEELWKATIKKDCEEIERKTRIDTNTSASLERQLDQLRADIKSEAPKTEVAQPTRRDPPIVAAEDSSKAAPEDPGKVTMEENHLNAAMEDALKASPDGLTKDLVLPDEKEAEGEVCRRAVLSGCVLREDARKGSSIAAAASAACPLKPAVATPACLTLQAICYPRKSATGESSVEQTTPSTYFSSSMITELIPEPGDPLFTALAAFLALVSLIAALIVHP